LETESPQYSYPSGFNDTRIHKDVHVRASGNYHVWWPRQGYDVVDGPIANWPEGLLKIALGHDHHGDEDSPHHLRAVSTCNNPTIAHDVDLNQINVTQYQDFSRWLRLLTSCKVAGVSREDFVSWSISDPAYADDAEEIAEIWDIVKPNGKITPATLFAALKRQPAEVSIPPVPKHRRKMSPKDVDELSRMCRWLRSEREDEGALFWTACRLGNWRMEYVVTDNVLEDLLVRAAWEAGLRNKVRVLRQIRNGLRRGSLEWLSKHRADVVTTISGLSLSAMGKTNNDGGAR
jgi:hypothetical protein